MTTERSGSLRSVSGSPVSADALVAIDTSDARKARGAFFTPPAIAQFLARWAVAGNPKAEAALRQGVRLSGLASSCSGSAKRRCRKGAKTLPTPERRSAGKPFARLGVPSNERVSNRNLEANRVGCRLSQRGPKFPHR